MRGDSWSNGIAGAVRAGEVDRGWGESDPQTSIGLRCERGRGEIAC